MTLSLSVTFETGSSLSPNYLIAVSGLSGITGATTVEVIRDYMDGSPFVTVRGLNKIPVVGDSATSTDYENSFQRGTWTYRVNVYDISNALLATQDNGSWDPAAMISLVQGQVPMASALIQSIQQPALNLAAVVNDMPTWEYPTNIQSTNVVLGREDPVVIAGEFGARTGSFILLQTTEFTGEQLDTYISLLKYNDVLLFQPFYSSAGVTDLYFRVTGLSVARVTNAGIGMNQDDAAFLITVGFQEVDRPATSQAASDFATWQDVLDHFATWQDVYNNRSSWLDVLNRADQS